MTATERALDLVYFQNQRMIQQAFFFLLQNELFLFQNEVKR